MGLITQYLQKNNVSPKDPYHKLLKVVEKSTTPLAVIITADCMFLSKCTTFMQFLNTAGWYLPRFGILALGYTGGSYLSNIYDSYIRKQLPNYHKVDGIFGVLTAAHLMTKFKMGSFVLFPLFAPLIYYLNNVEHQETYSIMKTRRVFFNEETTYHHSSVKNYDKTDYYKNF